MKSEEAIFLDHPFHDFPFIIGLFHDGQLPLGTGVMNQIVDPL